MHISCGTRIGVTRFFQHKFVAPEGGHKIFDHQGGHKNIAEVFSENHDPHIPKKMVAT